MTRHSGPFRHGRRANASVCLFTNESAQDRPGQHDRLESLRNQLRTFAADRDWLPPEALAEVRAEVADVLLYLIRISDKLGIDLIAAAQAKIELNAAKYPVHPLDKARGSSKKYAEL